MVCIEPSEAVKLAGEALIARSALKTRPSSFGVGVHVHEFRFGRGDSISV